MDALSLGLLGLGLLAAIGAVFVAMSESDTQEATQEPAKQVLAPRRRRRPTQAVPNGVTTIATPPATNTPVTSTGMNGTDPLSMWLGEQVQVLASELQKLREQEQLIERRLRLMNGISILMRDTDASSLNGNGGSNGSSSTSNSTRSRRSGATRSEHRS